MPRRRTFSIGAAGVVTVLVFASAAYACVTMKGKLTIKNNVSGGASKTWTGNNSHPIYFCSGGTPSPIRLSVGTAGFTMTTAKSVGSACESAIPSGSYQIALNATSNTNPNNTPDDCFIGPGGNGTAHASFNVTDTNGNGSKLITSSSLSGDYKVCVTDGASNEGIMGFINVA